jgi:hypothetical protein
MTDVASYDPSASAVAPLMATFWEPAGWRRPLAWPAREVMRSAIEAGVMFGEPRVEDHDGWVAALAAAREATGDLLAQATRRTEAACPCCTGRPARGPPAVPASALPRGRTTARARLDRGHEPATARPAQHRNSGTQGRLPRRSRRLHGRLAGRDRPQATRLATPQHMTRSTAEKAAQRVNRSLFRCRQPAAGRVLSVVRRVQLVACIGGSALNLREGQPRLDRRLAAELGASVILVSQPAQSSYLGCFEVSLYRIACDVRTAMPAGLHQSGASCHR